LPPSVFHDALPKIAGQYSGKLLIVGPGWSMNDDLAQWNGEGDVMVVNSAGGVVSNFKHWFTPHPEHLTIWRAMRSEPIVCEIHCKQGGVSSDGDRLHVWPINGRFAAWGGESATVVAVALGYDDITLAGIPADGKGKATGDPIPSAADYGEPDSITRWTWLRDNYFQGRVKSLSGKTREILC
jgi:hypothetical protein